MKKYDDTDIEYTGDELDIIKRTFNSFCHMYNIDYTLYTKKYQHIYFY